MAVAVKPTRSESSGLSGTVRSLRATPATGKVERRLARAAKMIGGTLAISALALGSAQFYRVSAATLGPGAFMLSIPKLVGGRWRRSWEWRVHREPPSACRGSGCSDIDPTSPQCLASILSTKSRPSPPA